MNRALLELALPIPIDCVMYDWWLALCAASGGDILFDPKATLLYRQHGDNVLGAKPIKTELRKGMIRALSMQRRNPEEFMSGLRQAAALETRLIERTSDETEYSRARSSAEFVTDYLALYRDPPSRIRRVFELHRRGIRRQNFMMDMMLKLRLLTRPIHFDDRPVDPSPYSASEAAKEAVRERP